MIGMTALKVEVSSQQVIKLFNMLDMHLEDIFIQFAGFRYIETDIEIEVDTHSELTISDKNVELNLKNHYVNNESYVLEVIEGIKKEIGRIVAKRY